MIAASQNRSRLGYLPGTLSPLCRQLPAPGALTLELLETPGLVAP